MINNRKTRGLNTAGFVIYILYYLQKLLDIYHALWYNEYIKRNLRKRKKGNIMKTYSLQMIRKIGNTVIPYKRLVIETKLEKELITYIKAGYIIESIQEVK